MPVKFELPDGGYIALGWDLREWTHPVVRVSFEDEGRGVMMLASPAQARGWMADILRQGGADDLADGLRHAAWEAMKLVPARRPPRPRGT
jgi:hypothetical protein